MQSSSYEEITAVFITLGEGVTRTQLYLKVIWDYIPKKYHYCLTFFTRKEDNIRLKLTGEASGKLTKKLLQIFSVKGCPVTVDALDCYNFRLGIISHSELQYMVADELFKLLPPEFMIADKKPTSKSAIVGLLPDNPLPPTVILVWATLQVRPYFPFPTRCFNAKSVVA